MASLVTLILDKKNKMFQPISGKVAVWACSGSEGELVEHMKSDA